MREDGEADDDEDNVCVSAAHLRRRMLKNARAIFEDNSSNDSFASEVNAPARSDQIQLESKKCEEQVSELKCEDELPDAVLHPSTSAGLLHRGILQTHLTAGCSTQLQVSHQLSHGKLNPSLIKKQQMVDAFSASQFYELTQFFGKFETQPEVAYVPGLTHFEINALISVSALERARNSNSRLSHPAFQRASHQHICLAFSFSPVF